MLRAKDIRTGNIIFLSLAKSPVVVDWRVIKYLQESGNTSCIYESILLTVELLEQFGFEKALYTDGEVYYQKDETDYSRGPYNYAKTWKCFRLRMYKDIWYFEVHSEAIGHMFCYQEICNTVHDLQNVYHIWTKKELDIKAIGDFILPVL